MIQKGLHYLLCRKALEALIGLMDKFKDTTGRAKKAHDSLDTDQVPPGWARAAANNP